MSWFHLLALTGSPAGRGVSGQKVLLVTRMGIPASDVAALARELGCDLIVLRPPGSELYLGHGFRIFRGHCRIARVPGYSWCGGREPGDLSPLRLLEQGRALARPGSPIERIAEQGRGCYLHWRSRLFFSSSDNSDPDRNNRLYLIRVEPEPREGEVLDWSPGHGGHLRLDQATARAVGRAGFGAAILAEPPDPNLPCLIRQLRSCGLRNLVLLAGPRWIRLPLDNLALARPELLIPLAGQAGRRAAKALFLRVGVLVRGRSGPAAGPLPDLARKGASLVSHALAGIRAQGGVQGNPSPQPARLSPRQALFLDALAREQARPETCPAPAQAPLRIVQYIGQLWPGGAERQMIYLGAGLKRAGHQVRVATSGPLSGDAAHYAPLLEEKGLSWGPAGKTRGLDLLGRALADPGIKRNLPAHLPPALSRPVLALLADLIRYRPQVVHCWLDWNNIIGGLAAWLAGTPLIVLSTRNLNPSHFPRFHRPWQREWYSFLAGSRRVCFVANSRAGGEDYARWLGLEPGSIQVIRNGLDPALFAQPSPAEIKSLYQELDLPPGQPLVGGVFRLDAEKRPYDFLKVIRTAREAGARFRALIVGQGSMERGLAREIQRLGLGGTVRLLGRRDDVARIMAACQVILLTSAQEGTPNVLMEAQLLGRAIVATRVGGVAETVLPGQSALLHRTGDTIGMAASLVGLLNDQGLRERMGRAGQKWVKQTFDLERTVDQTLSLYRERLGIPPEISLP